MQNARQSIGDGKVAVAVVSQLATKTSIDSRAIETLSSGVAVGGVRATLSEQL